MSLLHPIPVVETERLILRGPAFKDLDAMATFFAGTRSRFVGGPKTRHETWRGLIGMLGHWQIRGYGVWMLEEKTSAQPVGAFGIINHEGWDEPELAWHLYDGFEGKGFAQEGARAARNYAAKTWGITAPISYINPDNARSVALATRLGAGFEREGSVLGRACHVYRHPKMEAA